MPVKGLLQRMQRIAARQTLDRDQRGAVGLHREHQAGSAASVAHDRAGAADAVLASDMRPRQPKFSRRKSTRSLRGSQRPAGRAVDGQADIILRQRSPPPIRCAASPHARSVRTRVNSRR